MNELSLFRLYVLRALYLFIVLGLAINVWPEIIRHEQWKLFEGIVTCMLFAFSLLCILGLRYPLLVLPILIWELVWKTLWLVIVALPHWWAGDIDPAIVPNIFACSIVVLVYIAMPWSYAYALYFKKPGSRWVDSSAQLAQAGAR